MTFYENYLGQDIPANIKHYLGDDSIFDAEIEGDDFEQELRGLEIVQLSHPRKKIKLCSPDYGLSGKIRYQFIVVEVAKNNLVGYVFVKSDISLTNTLRHFLDKTLPEFGLSLSTLQICTPRVLNKNDEPIKRTENLKTALKNIGETNSAAQEIFQKTNYYYIDELAWEYCLNEELLEEKERQALEPNTSEEKTFIDQELFRLRSSETEQSELSLEYIERVIASSRKYRPIMAIIGQAGVGKSTFCKHAERIVNGKPQKMTIKISSEDLNENLRRSSLGKEVESISDLYQILSQEKYFENSYDLLESNNLEINMSCGNIVLIIDGIDEIESVLGSNFNLESFLESIEELSHAHENCFAIITSRDYKVDRYLDKDFIETYQLLGFSDESMENYISKKGD